MGYSDEDNSRPVPVRELENVAQLGEEPLKKSK